MRVILKLNFHLLCFHFKKFKTFQNKFHSVNLIIPFKFNVEKFTKIFEFLLYFRKKLRMIIGALLLWLTYDFLKKTFYFAKFLGYGTLLSNNGINLKLDSTERRQQFILVNLFNFTMRLIGHLCFRKLEIKSIISGLVFQWPTGLHFFASLMHVYLTSVFCKLSHIQLKFTSFPLLLFLTVHRFF